jgi:hypothetical protein
MQNLLSFLFILVVFFSLFSCEDEGVIIDNPDPIDTVIVDPIDTTVVDTFYRGYIEGLRVQNSVGYVPPSTNFMVIDGIRYNTSEHEYLFVEDVDGDSLIVYPPNHPNGLSSWDVVYNSTETNIFLTNGDYRSLGLFEPNFEPNARKILRAYTQPRIHTARGLVFDDDLFYVPSPEEHVILEGFQLEYSSNWSFYQLVFAGMSDERNGVAGPFVNSIRYSDNVIVSDCSFPNIIKAGIRIFEGNYNLIQRNYFRAKKAHFFAGFGGDLAGVVIREIKRSQGNIITMNESHNMGDFFGSPNLNNYDPTSEKLPNTIVSNNWIWTDEFMRHLDENGNIVTCSEDGLDLKTGGLPNMPMLISGNIIWGHRPTNQECGGSGSSGAGIVIHNDVKDLIVQNNIIFDVYVGMTMFGHNKKFPNTESKRILVDNNLFCHLPNYTIIGRENVGLAISTNTDSTTFINNSIISANHVFYMKQRNTVNGVQIPINRTITNNLFINCFGEQLTLQNLNNTEFENNFYLNAEIPNNGATLLPVPFEYRDLIINVKPWSIPEQITLEGVIPTSEEEVITHD